MTSVNHINTSYWDWFGDEEYFSSRISDVLWVGRKETLQEDFERLRKILGLPEHVCLEKKNIRQYGKCDLNTSLCNKGKIVLSQWYYRDFEFLSFCKRLGLL